MLDRLALTLRLLPLLPKLARHRPDGRLTAADRLESRARHHGGRDALVFEGRTLTWSELNARANRVAHWARAQGLGTGDAVALLMANRAEYVETWAGLAKLGVTTALLNTNLAGRALEHAVEASGARHVVVGAECLDRWVSAPALAEWKEVWVRTDPGAPASAAPPAGAADLDAALGGQDDTDPPAGLRETLRAKDPLFYIYTSGTTGLPKAAVFSHLRFLTIGELVAFALSLGPDDVFYCALPLYHTAGGVMLVSSCLTTGATIALRRRFSASRFWDEVRATNATCFQYIGEFCRYLVNQPPDPRDRDHRIRAVIGNGLRPDVWPVFQERFGIETIREFYGSTEGNVAIMNFENEVGSVGRMPHAALTNARLIRFDVESETPLRGPDGHCIECAPGEVGELVGRIPATSRSAVGRFEGYTSREESERKILRNVFREGDAYFRSGDLLRTDERGFLYFVDRIGDTFRWKGENVSTQEVAEALAGHPGLELVNVYGVEVPGAEGRAGMAALVLTPGTEFDGRALLAHAREQLPDYAVPCFVRLLTEQDMTGTFKMRKVDLQREGFDPGATSEPLLVRDDAAGAYVPLTAQRYEEIRSGARAL